MKIKWYDWNKLLKIDKFRIIRLKKKRKINPEFDKAKIENLFNDSLGFIEGLLPMEDKK